VRIDLTPRRWTAALAAIVLISCARVAATHRVFSQTFDEGIHVAAGHEWLTEWKEYRVDAQHPPLARILFGLPVARETTNVPKYDPIARGNELLNGHDHYWRNLARARLGNLLFLALGIVVVALWGRRAISPLGGLIAAALFAMLPPVLAHAGLATTDMAITATLPLALYALTLFLEAPTWRRSIFLGVAIALAALSKFSFLMFFPIGAAIIVIARVAGLKPGPHPMSPLPQLELDGSMSAGPSISPTPLGTGQGRHPGLQPGTSPIPPDSEQARAGLHTGTSPTPPSTRQVRHRMWAGLQPGTFTRALVAAAIAFVITWGGYKFQVGPMTAIHDRPAQMCRELFGSEWLAHVPLPAPAFAAGAIEVKLHDKHGHQAFLLGETSRHGWWGYFPFVLAVKTPIPFLLLALAGLALALWRRRMIDVALIPLALLAASMTSGINLGVRHVLPLYPFLTILAAYAVVELLPHRLLPRGERGAKRWLRVALASILLLWLAADSVLAHPDYLPWMNAFAGSHPERVLEDSNFDWGQDVGRLVQACRRENIHQLHTALFTSADLDRLGLPPRIALDPAKPASGWCAISESELQPALAADPVAYWWLTEGHPYRRIGKTVRLYHIP
jgi:hypothetical protein